MGLFGERWPFTNFHDLNLDWILEQVKNDKTIIEQLRQYVENVDDEIEQKIEEEVPILIQESINNGLLSQVATAVRTRRIVIVGDSYGQGYTPGGNVTGYPERIRQKMGLITGINFFNVNKGGARFGSPQNDEYAFDTVLTNFLAAITNKESITDIIIAGGYNDATYANSDITAGINRTMTVIKNNFSNPSLKVWLFGLGYSADNPRRREQLFDIYHNSYAASGMAFTSLTKTLYNDDYWSSDGFHPNSTGQEEIATAIINIINGGNTVKYALIREFDHPTNTPSGSNIYINACENYFNCFLYLNSQFEFSEAISLSGTTPVKISEFNSKLPLTITDSVAEIQKFQIQAILYTPDVQDTPSYQKIDAVMYIQQESRGVYGIYLGAFELNDAGSNYKSFTGITKIIIPKGTPFIYIPMRF